MRKNTEYNPGQVIIPVGHPCQPEPHEVDVAYILARHYKTDVEFLMPIDDYMRKTPDIKMLGTEWEIKSPKGTSKSTIRNQFRRASKQSKSIVLDTRRTKLKLETIEESVLIEMRNRPYIKKVILIDKSEKIVEIKK